MEVAGELLASKERARVMAEAGREVISSRQGATERHAALLLDHLGGGGGSRERVPRPGPRKVRRFLLTAFLLYMAAGYLTSAFGLVQVADATPPSIPLHAPARTLVSGVFSVHTVRSHDAQGTREEVGAAAASAGLDFVVIGDHPPDDRRPEWAIWEPEFLDGVLVDGGLELRAPEAGKVLAMGVDSAYRQWGGDIGSFMNFLARQEATSMVVHGRGPRGSERWVHDTVGSVQGWEVLDLSEASRARVRGPWSLYHLLTFVAGYPLGLADEALLHTMREGFGTPSVAAYDSLRQRGPLTATAGLNVHPKVKLGPVLLPSYGPFFRTLVSHLVMEAPLPSDPSLARGMLSWGIRRGELFISLGDHLAATGFRLVGVPHMGPDIPMGADVPAGSVRVFRGGFEEEPGRKVVYRILRDGSDVEWIMGPDLQWEPPGTGLYRVEVYTYGTRVGSVFFRLKPWILANPIRLVEE
jgi:hypothetical protein